LTGKEIADLGVYFGKKIGKLGRERFTVLGDALLQKSMELR
jgi:hypothetical protein